MNNKASAPVPDYGGYYPPPAVPPSYYQVTGGVQPSSPYVPPTQTGMRIVTTVVPVGPNPTHTICPMCQKEINTKVQKKTKCLAYISGILLCIFGCVCGCCLIPCCLDECKEIHHTCPECGTYVGRYM